MTVIYNLQMFEVRQTTTFRDWLDHLPDRKAIERIAQRIVRLQAGLFGDVRPVGGGLSELRVDHGPGYRLYFVRRGQTLFVLLCGGDKGSQRHVIAQAKIMAAELEVE
jgi:putative addiction module killer protein